MSEYDRFMERTERDMERLRKPAPDPRPDRVGLVLMVLGGILGVLGATLLLTMLVMWAFFDQTLGANPEGVVFLGFIGMLAGLGLTGMGAEF